MFNNLIESSSHAKEFKRRGSFLLLTTATYFVLLVLAGVGSIYAYDAHLDSQSTELEITFMPLVPDKTPVVEVRNTIRSASSDSNRTPTQSTRTELIASTSDPNKIPDKLGVEAVRVPPARSDSIIGPANADPPAPAFSGRPGTGTGDTPHVELGENPPLLPPTPTPKPAPTVLRISKILNSQALLLPKPNYPIIAKQAGVQGTVSVQVMIDETGKVISAKGTGHPLLVPEAQRAALQARFSPTIVGETPVKVSGVITYNFIR